ncbi:hypothetical protein [Nocardia sp. CY41]|uniref:hypothetical protein n=1 Tax=Nocardia sp. CY41 TaxID=2608686 RepID=UPI00135818AF|nr:hypothetical protein [Nocardia sp. CY41]
MSKREKQPERGRNTMGENANEKNPTPIAVVADRDHAAAIASLDAHVDGLTGLMRSAGYDPTQAWGRLVMMFQSHDYDLREVSRLAATAIMRLAQTPTPTPAAGIWAAAEAHAPELLGVLAHVGTVTLDDREVHRYEHVRTRRYLNLDRTGQAWWIATGSDGQTFAHPMDLAQATARVQQSTAAHSDDENTEIL